ncbi:MAG TPA: hypothetical protein VGE34_03790 [Candidatus Saccharimonadales bacterium]
MIQMIHQPVRKGLLAIFGMAVGALVLGSMDASALTPIPTPDPKPGSYGIEATKTKAPPSRGARITVPANGSSPAKSPITVRGICPNDLLVQVYNNGVMVGAVMCKSGSFSVEVSLFSGKNELTALVYDELNQAGPKSNTVTVNFKDTSFAEFGQQLTLTSAYGRRSAAAGSDLNWPLQLSGGTGPYAFSIDWGDNGKPELKSQSIAGVVSLAHAYNRAGIYRVNVTATDVNGVTAFLQVIAVSNGKVAEEAKTAEKEANSSTEKVLWVPSLAAFILLLPSYWLGRRSQVVSLRSKMLKERDAYQEK